MCMPYSKYGEKEEHKEVAIMKKYELYSPVEIPDCKPIAEEGKRKYFPCRLVSSSSFNDTSTYHLGMERFQHQCHHEDGHVASGDFYILTFDSVPPLCNNSCNKRETRNNILEAYQELGRKITDDRCYMIQPRFVERHMICGLRLTEKNVRTFTYGKLVQIHNDHHDDKHFIKVNIVSDFNPIGYYINENGKCSCDGMNSFKNIFSEFEWAPYCGIKQNNGNMFQMQCGMIIPTFMQETTKERYKTVHNSHHQMGHTAKTMIFSETTGKVCTCELPDIRKPVDVKKSRKLVI